MIEKVWDSIKGHIAHKTSDPFFGIFIVIWLIKNWNLTYSLLNFDPGTTLEQKRIFVLQHFQSVPFIKTLGMCLLEAFVILIITYIVINISRLIINVFEKQVTPKIYEITDKGSVVLKSVYEELLEEKGRLETRLEDEKIIKYRLQQDIEKLEARNIELLQKKTKIPLVKIENENTISSDKMLEGVMGKFVNENKIQSFEKIVEGIKNHRSIDQNSSFTQELLKLGIIEYKKESYTGGSAYYELTTFGEKLRQRIIMESFK